MLFDLLLLGGVTLSISIGRDHRFRQVAPAPGRVLVRLVGGAEVEQDRELRAAFFATGEVPFDLFLLGGGALAVGVGGDHALRRVNQVPVKIMITH